MGLIRVRLSYLSSFLPHILSAEASPKEPNARAATALIRTGEGAICSSVN